jgi:signal transduction histidine kinase
MANELLELSKIESGRFFMDRSPIAAGDLLKSAGRRMQLQAKRAQLKLRVECAENLPKVQADSQRIEQVLGKPDPQRGQIHRPGWRSRPLRGTD